MFSSSKTSSGSAYTTRFDQSAASILPPRSPLYPEEQIGVGTPLVESLTTYVGRLAESHLVSVGDLVGRFLSEIPNPVGSLITSAAKSHRANGFEVFGYELNGIGAQADAWVYALEAATSILQFQNLTFLPLKGALSERLFKRHRAWCPICFEEWRTTEQVIYEPLLWAVDLCSFCPVHTQPLRHVCPTCERRRPPLTCRFRPGYCDRCGVWLGSSETAVNHCDGGPETAQEQIIIARQVGGLLELLPRLNPDRAIHSLRRNLNDYISSAARGNARALADQIGCSDETVRNWANGPSAPHLDGLLRMSLVLNVPLSSFYEPDGLSASNLAAAQEAIAKQISKPYQPANKVKEAMLAALRADPPRRIGDVAKELGYSGPEPLYRVDSSLSRAITKRYREYIQGNLPENIGNRRIREETEVREALEKALASDKPASVNQIADSLGYARNSALYQRFPDLIKSITKKSADLKKERQAEIRRHLQRALTEETPPSLHELGKRLGCTNYILRTSEPDLYGRIAERHHDWRLQQKAELGRRAVEVITQSPSSSLTGVAKKLGVSPTCLRKHFPALAKDIADQHRASEQAAKEKRLERLSDEVLRIVTALHKRGVYPSTDTIAPKLDKGISRNIMAIDAAVKTARAAIGLR